MRAPLCGLLAPVCLSWALGCAPAAPPVVPPPPTPPPDPPAADAPAPSEGKDTCAEGLSPDGSLAVAAERLLTAELCDAWFTPDMLAAVPPAKVEEIRGAFAEQLGKYQRIAEEDGQMFAVYERGRLPTKVVLDHDKRLAGLWFNAPQMTGVSLPELVAGFEKLPGTVSVLVLTDGEEVAASHAERSLAVGSAFKLAVLAALADKEKKKGAAAWKSIVELQASDPSLPSGQLQSWPAGIPLTTGSLAALMISNSDNTATDVLMRYVGRDAVEKHGAKNRPFMTTREMFLVKDPTYPDRLERYRKGDEKARRALLAGFADVELPRVEAIAGMKPSPDVEWFFTGRELCDLMEKVHALPAMHINPGLTDAKRWGEVAFKGGSEPGVLNLTTRVEGGGHHHCVVATWNHAEPLAEDKFMTLYGSLMGALPTK